MAMPDHPRITIVTASFNALDGLRQTVESVASQEYPNVQHVIVDGGSTDGTRAYLESLGGAVSWISEPDEGIADAMNKGIAMADGEWVLVLQAEDTFFENHSLSRAVRHLSGDGMVGFDVLFDKGEGGIERLPSRKFSRFTNYRMLNPHQGLFCARAMFEDIGGFDPKLRLTMDYDHILRAKFAGYGLKTVPQIISVMPATGISSRETWSARHEMLAEQAKVHRKNARNFLQKLSYYAFWAAFYPAYFVKWHLLRNTRFY